MRIPIRVDEAIYNRAKQVASAEFLTIPRQIEFWATLGPCALNNPDLPINFIKDLLISKNTDPSLAESFYFE